MRRRGHIVGAVTALVALAAAVTSACSNEGTSGTKAGEAATSTAAGTMAVSATGAAVDPPGLAVVLGRPTDRSIAVSASVSSATPVAVRWRAAPSGPEQTTPAVTVSAGPPHTFELTGLRADTEYSYRMVVGGIPGAVHRFHTQRPPGSTFVVGLEADAHHGDPNTSPDVWAVTLANLRADRPDFVIDLGDLFMTEKLRAETAEAVTRTIADVRPSLGIVGADAALFLVNGNHEGELGWMIGAGRTPEVPRWSTLARQASYPTPAPGPFYSGATRPDPTMGAPRDAWYSWTWGDAQFIVLDPFWYTNVRGRGNGPSPDNWSRTLGKNQYDWLSASLAASKSKYIFVYIHHLVGGRGRDARGGVESAGWYEWGGRNEAGVDEFAVKRPGWAKPIHQMLVEHKVAAVFHGHDHMYVHNQLDGVVYQLVPQPGNARGGTGSAEPYGYTSGLILGSPGHLRVFVGPDSAKVEFVRSVRGGSSGGGRRGESGKLGAEVAHQWEVKPRAEK